MTDSQELRVEYVMRLFQSGAAASTASSRRSYSKAVASFESFVAGRNLQSQTLTSRIVFDWISSMWLRGLSASTIIQYFNVISALGSAAAPDAFSGMGKRLRYLRDSLGNPAELDAALKSLRQFTSVSHKRPSAAALAADMILISLANGAMPLERIASLKVAEIDTLSPKSRETARRNSDSRRKYVMNLRQPDRTPAQLRRYVESVVATQMAVNGISLIGSADDTIRTLYAFAALRSGFAASDVADALGQASAEIPVLRLMDTDGDTLCDSAAISDAVADVVTVNPSRWFAMRLRPRIKYTDLHERLHQMDAAAIPELFYPCDEIRRRVGKKHVTAQRPVIPDIVFFRTRITDIPPLFSRIGDLAWCYTSGSSRSGSYASISDRAFRNFQLAIGRFTSSFEVASIGCLPPRPGDRIVIVGGLIPGQAGDILKIETDESENVIYRIQFMTDNNIKWNFGIDARLTHSPENDGGYM